MKIKIIVAMLCFFSDVWAMDRRPNPHKESMRKRVEFSTEVFQTTTVAAQPVIVDEGILHPHAPILNLNVMRLWCYQIKTGRTIGLDPSSPDHNILVEALLNCDNTSFIHILSAISFTPLHYAEALIIALAQSNSEACRALVLASGDCLLSLPLLCDILFVTIPLIDRVVLCSFLDMFSQQLIEGVIEELAALFKEEKNTCAIVEFLTSYNELRPIFKKSAEKWEQRSTFHSAHCSSILTSQVHDLLKSDSKSFVANLYNYELLFNYLNEGVLLSMQEKVYVISVMKLFYRHKIMDFFRPQDLLITFLISIILNDAGVMMEVGHFIRNLLTPGMMAKLIGHVAFGPRDTLTTLLDALSHDRQKKSLIIEFLKQKNDPSWRHKALIGKLLLEGGVSARDSHEGQIMHYILNPSQDSHLALFPPEMRNYLANFVQHRSSVYY